jgi:hypothetical protein
VNVTVSLVTRVQVRFSEPTETLCPALQETSRSATRRVARPSSMRSTEKVVSRTRTKELPDSVTEHEFPEHETMLTLEEPGSPDEPLTAQALLELQHAVSTPSSRAGMSTYAES